LIIDCSHGLSLEVNISYFGVDEVGIVLVTQKLTHRRRNFASRNHAGGHLVQHRLEQVVVFHVNQGDINVVTLELLCGSKPALARADDLVVVAATVWTKWSISHCEGAPFL